MGKHNLPRPHNHSHAHYSQHLLHTMASALGEPSVKPNVQQGVNSEAAEALRMVASALLQQAIQLLQQIANTPNGESILTHESTLIPGSTIGKHLRHSLDHYRLLLDSVPRAGSSGACATSSQSTSGGRASSFAAEPLQVNYDTRMRLLDMEKNPVAALKKFQEADEKLNEVVAGTSLEQPLHLTALTPYHQEFESSFGRELWFVALHAIHHYSLLRVIATGELHLTLPENFGVAPSTLAFREFSKATPAAGEAARQDVFREARAGGREDGEQGQAIIGAVATAGRRSGPSCRLTG